MSLVTDATTPVFTKVEPTNETTDSTCYGDSGGALLEIDPTRPSDALLVGVLAQSDVEDPARTCVPGTRAGYSSPSCGGMSPR